MSRFWKNKKILVTGGAGFLGSRVVENLVKKRKVKKENIFVPRSSEFDLRKEKICRKVVADIDVVIHLAGNVGGIGYNLKNPGTLFYDNLSMGLHLMEESRKAGLKKFVAVGTICAYPKFSPIPFKEENLWSGYPEETNAAYGLAKKMLLVQAQAYRRQYGFNAIYLLPVNLYGPGDSFDSDRSHVIPGLIKKFVEARNKNKSEVIVWGTGKPTREFLYVEDASEGILLATEKYNKPDPINLGASFEISIKNLCELIAKIVGFRGKIVFDKTNPDGQPRRKLDTSKANIEFGFKAKTIFKKGLEETIDWYEKKLSSSSTY